MKSTNSDKIKANLFLIVNKDESFVQTPKRGKLFLVVDNTREVKVESQVCEKIENQKNGTESQSAVIF